MAPSFALALLRSVREENAPENRSNLASAEQPGDSTDSATSPRHKPRKKLSQIIARPSTPLQAIRLPRPSSPLPLLRRSHTQSMATAQPTAPFLEHKQQSPTSILVLSHGLQGTVEDFSYLLETLDSTDEVSSGSMLVHASRVNTDKTHDGIDLGGLRLAEDIRHTVAKYSSLTSISMIGFSLGGLYVRYAAAHLFDQRTGKIAGLTADKIAIVASPNLGLRQFGVYRFFQSMMPIAHGFLFNSAKQLFLRDEDCLLELMTRDTLAKGGAFLSALMAFRQKVLYANLRNDFMVNYGTAALDEEVKELSCDALERVMRGFGATTIDEDADEKGCRVCFQFEYAAAADGGARVRDQRAQLDDGDAVERLMGARLRALGWTVIGVDFPMPAPLAHNRIVAMSRNVMHTWMNAGGRRVVHHLVDQLCAPSPPTVQTRLFRRVSRGAEEQRTTQAPLLSKLSLKLSLSGKEAE